MQLRPAALATLIAHKRQRVSVHGEVSASSDFELKLVTIKLVGTARVPSRAPPS